MLGLECSCELPPDRRHGGRRGSGSRRWSRSRRAAAAAAAAATANCRRSVKHWTKSMWAPLGAQGLPQPCRCC